MLVAFAAVAPAFDRLSLRQCLVVIEMCERLFQYAYTDNVAGDRDIIDEIRVVLVQYLSHYGDNGGS